jgi:hypothetical protein
MNTRYKRIFKESDIKDEDNLIYLSYSQIGVQDPFRIPSKNFNVDIEKIINMTRDNLDKYKKITDEVKNINKEFNEIRQILYSYTLSKVAEIQNMINNS